jgi:glycine cleavage system aminomethyltransferase T
LSPRTGGDKLFADGRVVGAVTSGAVSPSISRPIGLAMLEVACTEVGTQLTTSDGGTGLVSARPFVGKA